MIAKEMIAKEMIAKEMIAKEMIAKEMIVKEMIVKEMIVKEMIAKEMIVKEMIVKEMIARKCSPQTRKQPPCKSRASKCGSESAKSKWKLLEGFGLDIASTPRRATADLVDV